MLNRVGIGLFFILFTVACSNLPGRVDLASLDCCFNLDTLVVVVEPPAGKTVFNQYDPATQRFLNERNPWVLRDMAERLLEAANRGLWTGADQQQLELLKDLVISSDCICECFRFW